MSEIIPTTWISTKRSEKKKNVSRKEDKEKEVSVDLLNEDNMRKSENIGEEGLTE